MVNRYNKGQYLTPDDEIKLTGRANEAEFLNAPQNKNGGFVQQNNHQRIQEEYNQFTQQPGPPLKTTLGIIKELKESVSHDKSNETNYSGPSQNFKSIYKKIDDELKEPNKVLLEDYKGNLNSIGPGQAREHVENIQVNNFKEDIINRDSIKLHGTKNKMGNGESNMGYYQLNTLKESEGRIIPGSSIVSNSPNQFNKDIKGKDTLKIRPNIDNYKVNLNNSLVIPHVSNYNKY
jgi:hypothetical protein